MPQRDEMLALLPKSKLEAAKKVYAGTSLQPPKRVVEHDGSTNPSLQAIKDLSAFHLQLIRPLTWAQ